jgi:hypothetical protein
MRARGVEPFLLTVRRARRFKRKKWERRPQTPPGAVVRRVFINQTRLSKKARLGNQAAAFSRKKSKNKCFRLYFHTRV